MLTLGQSYPVILEGSGIEPTEHYELQHIDVESAPGRTQCPVGVTLWGNQYSTLSKRHLSEPVASNGLCLDRLPPRGSSGIAISFVQACTPRACLGDDTGVFWGAIPVHLPLVTAC